MEGIASSPEDSFRFLDSLFDARDLTIELLFVDLLQQLTDARPRGETELEQVSAEQQWRRRSMLDAERAGSRQEPVHCGAVECAGASETVGAREAREQFQVDLLRETAKRAVSDVGGFVEHAGLQVVRDEADHLTPHVEAVDRVDVQPIRAD